MAQQPTGQMAPSVRSVTSRGSVNVPGMAAGAWWPLFDYQTLAATATTEQQFFAVPKGQSGKTATDTNMELAGQIPAGQRFVITGVGIEILPAVDISQTGVDGTVNDFANDVYAVLSTGRLKLTIGSKDYINHGNLFKFPPLNRLDAQTAVSTTVTTTTLKDAYGVGIGAPFATVDTVLMASQNFGVTLFDLPALPSGVAAKIGVNLYGWLYRNAQ